MTAQADQQLVAAQLVARFYRALDHGTPADVAAVFAPDGEWLRLGERLVGPRAVTEALDKRVPGRRSRHLVSNLLVDAEGEDRIVASYAVTVYAGLAGAGDTVPSAVIDTRDLLMRNDAGEWLFQLHEGTIVFRRPASPG